MKMYGIKTCASVKKAKAFFDENNISYEFIDLNKTPVNKDKIEKWQNFTPAASMLNPRSKSYRDLGLKDKKVTDKKAVSLIENDNGILKRPVIEHGLNGEEKFTIGFNEKEYNDTFLN
ncbi:arsenate reductase family protein [Halarcobacter anaerophilus]|jgi:Spx/MgsR family transcriptional regulator|uniref:arsenate reductase family protein n=1 Tax=Halarcobacter anaerophilus TaxID=877500 RepID=UPI0005CA65AB|nr:Spx/MgsR family RNA polymerase-binding regulatory protein [Halarcobacter anaerophilus]